GQRPPPAQTRPRDVLRGSPTPASRVPSEAPREVRWAGIQSRSCALLRSSCLLPFPWTPPSRAYRASAESDGNGQASLRGLLVLAVHFLRGQRHRVDGGVEVQAAVGRDLVARDQEPGPGLH